MSPFSPGSVTQDECLVRFAFHPIHFSKGGTRLKPSIFSHAETKGCSIQRDGHATDGELVRFVTEFIEKDDRRAWQGVLTASCQLLRDIRIDGHQERAICIYDTAEERNPAHGEFGWSSLSLEEGDSNELRRRLMAAFSDGAITAPREYRSGAIFKQLRAEHQSR